MLARAIRFTYCTDTMCTTLEAQKQRAGNQKNRRIRPKPSMLLYYMITPEMGQKYIFIIFKIYYIDYSGNGSKTHICYIQIYYIDYSRNGSKTHICYIQNLSYWLLQKWVENTYLLYSKFIILITPEMGRKHIFIIFKIFHIDYSRNWSKTHIYYIQNLSYWLLQKWAENTYLLYSEMGKNSSWILWKVYVHIKC